MVSGVWVEGTARVILTDLSLLSLPCITGVLVSMQIPAWALPQRYTFIWGEGLGIFILTNVTGKSHGNHWPGNIWEFFPTLRFWETIHAWRLGSAAVTQLLGLSLKGVVGGCTVGKDISEPGKEPEGQGQGSG